MMHDSDVDELGPVDYVVVSFPLLKPTSRVRWQPN